MSNLVFFLTGVIIGLAIHVLGKVLINDSDK